MCIIYILCNVYYIYNGRRQPWILNEGNPRIKLPNLDSDMPRLLPVAQLFAEFHRICVGRPAPEALSQLQSSLPVWALNASRERHLRVLQDWWTGFQAQHFNERNISEWRRMACFLSPSPLWVCPKNWYHHNKAAIFGYVPHFRTTPSATKKKQLPLSTYPHDFFNLYLSHQENTSPVGS